MKINRKKILVCFGVILILLNFTARYSIAKCPTRMGSVFPQESFLVIAHRGSTIKKARPSILRLLLGHSIMRKK